MLDKKIYGFVTVGSKGQIVIPADAREALRINPGDHVFVVGSEHKGLLALVPEANATDLLNKINQKVEDFERIRERGPEDSEDEGK